MPKSKREPVRETGAGKSEAMKVGYIAGEYAKAAKLAQKQQQADEPKTHTGRMAQQQ